MPKQKRDTSLLMMLLSRFQERGFVMVAFLALSLLLLPLFSFTRANTAHVYAAPSDTLNFQARLQTSGGAIVPDGHYNIEFKLYTASTGGSALWTETYAYNSGSGSCSGPAGSNDCRVRVVHGYVSVYLGSITTFPSTIPWDQQLYLTMNVGGTTSSGSVTYDGEMTPRLKLTSVPYAMQAKSASQLQTSTGGNQVTISTAGTPTGNVTYTFDATAAPGTYDVCTSASNCAVAGGSGNYIQNQDTAAQNSASFWIDGIGKAATGLQGPSLDTIAATILTLGSTNANATLTSATAGYWGSYCGTGDASAVTTGVQTAATNYTSTMEGYIQTTAAGTLQLRMKSEVAAATTVMAGSFGILQVVQ